MRKESLAPAGTDLVLILAMTLLTLPLQSCLQPTSVDCGPDFACPAGMTCAANQNTCIEDNCGDGIRQAEEVCDDGNILDGDGCSVNCLSKEVCGNGITDLAVGEICDEGEKNAEAGGCDTTCFALEECGNNKLDPLEECDSGGKDTITCTAKCKISRCGDGHINTTAGEQCDTLINPTCNINCTLSVCGDSILNTKTGEECDSGQIDSSGKAKDTSTCDSDCTIPRCGDGHPNTAAGEECEPGPDSTCTTGCRLSTCGDGIVNTEAGEACDDGNNSDCGTCNEGCTQWKDFRTAIGSIAAAPSNDVNDGDWFSISDGSNRLTFEFDKASNGVQADRIPIYIAKDQSASTVASRIKDDIHSKRETLKIQARLFFNVIWLENKDKGESGNQPIDKGFLPTNTSTAIEVEGMADGAGVYCPAGTGCKYDRDCKSGKCQSGKCK